MTEQGSGSGERARRRRVSSFEARGPSGERQSEAVLTTLRLDVDGVGATKVLNVARVGASDGLGAERAALVEDEQADLGAGRAQAQVEELGDDAASDGSGRQCRARVAEGKRGGTHLSTESSPEMTLEAVTTVRRSSSVAR